MEEESLLIDTSTEYLDPRTMWPGFEATPSRIVWTGPSTLSTTFAMHRTHEPRLCPVTTIDGIPGAGPHDTAPTPCSQTTRFAYESVAMSTAIPTTEPETSTTQTAQQADPTQAPVPGSMNAYQEDAFGSGPWHILSAVLITTGILLINAILVMLWIDWRRRRRDGADIDGISANPPREGAAQPQGSAKEVPSQVSGRSVSMSREIGHEVRDVQSNFERLVLPFETDHEPIGVGVNPRGNAPIEGVWSPDESQDIELHRHEQEKVIGELRPPVARRSSVQSAHSKVSSLGHPPSSMDPAPAPPSPSEPSWGDVVMSSMSPVSPVSPLGEEEGLVSRMNSAKRL